jgi:catechol 2,3-dioxygenase-like lactoylglutathione lyase family enzyme
MKINLTSVFVNDQDKALKFYTEILGFIKKHDMPVWEFKWITVVSPDEQNGTELLLEPNDNPAAKSYQNAIFEQGIPAASFAVESMEKEFERLKSLDVVFTMEPTQMGPVMMSVFDDNCGNLIQITQKIEV